MRFFFSVMMIAAAAFACFKFDDNPAVADALSAMFSIESKSIDLDTQLDQLAEADGELYAVRGPEVHDFNEIFRFDLTPNQIMDRWGQVTTGLSELNFQGYRVPLVTGIEESDLAGSLTYYFDNRQQMQRIVFMGTTGNPTRIINLVVRHFRFHRKMSEDPRQETYVGRHRSFDGTLSIAPSDVVQHNDPNRKFGIELRIER